MGPVAVARAIAVAPTRLMIAAPFAFTRSLAVMRPLIITPTGVTVAAPFAVARPLAVMRSFIITPSRFAVAAPIAVARAVAVMRPLVVTPSRILISVRPHAETLRALGARRRPRQGQYKQSGQQGYAFSAFHYASPFICILSHGAGKLPPVHAGAVSQ